MPDFNRMQRERLAARNMAMPDGGFPIRNVSDLKNAIQAFGRAKNKPAVKAWIKKRAKQLGREDLLPENWRKSDVLVHGEWKEHKYIAKVKMKNGKYRYFYSQEEYNAYLSGKDEKKLEKSKTKKSDETLDSNPIVDFITRMVGGQAGLLVRDFVLPDLVKAGSEFVENTVGKFKYKYKIKLANGEYRYFYSEEEYQRYLNREKYQANEPDFMEDVPEYEDEMTMSENAEEVNPNYPYGEDVDMYSSKDDIYVGMYDEMVEKGYDPNNDEEVYDYMADYYPYSVNCSLCTLTYELRERGYDVEAKPNGWIDDDLKWHDKANTNVDWISTVYENPKSKSYGKNGYVDKMTSYDKYDILDDIAKEPAGSRGEIAVFWIGGGGHSVAYTVDENHEITVRDTQTNDTYSVEDLLKRSEYIRYTRTDNLELREECLQYVEYKEDDD